MGWWADEQIGYVIRIRCSSPSSARWLSPRHRTPSAPLLGAGQHPTIGYQGRRAASLRAAGLPRAIGSGSRMGKAR